jgi:hypothetical protein
MALFDRSLMLRDFPVRKDIVGVGLSDWREYADLLSEKFRYTNTYYHREPFLDITKPASQHSDCDFVISTEVLEQVYPPVQLAFDGARQMLKKGGSLILTVPYTNATKTIEHFGEFEEFQLVRFKSRNVVVGRRADDSVALRSDLVFHGGPGETLVLRVFCRNEISSHLARAGFGSVEFMEQNYPEWGIIHENPWSLPILARCP